jgi:hypothetical protein
MTTKSSKSSNNAQKQALPRRNCGVMSVHYWLLEQFPEFRVEQMAMEHSFAALRRTVQAAPKKPFMISVVVHVLHSSPMPKISKAQGKLGSGLNTVRLT